jgi:2-polyprenyl-3-methyl-5-hydroxy-6-metoxy-1,4-benzoquinol methylase
VDGGGLFGNDAFERDVDERRRLEYQFELLREDFDLWFDAALRLSGLGVDPARASWSVLDAGCGEGLFTREIARRYPTARVVGFDVDAKAVAVAAQRCAQQPNVRLFVHDVRQPIAGSVPGGGGFDLAVMWLVLPYLPDRRTALANVAATLRPGGMILLGNVPDEALRVDHPAAADLMVAARQLVQRLGLGGLQDSLAPTLAEVGLAAVTTQELRYRIGGATSSGHRWYRYMLTSMSTAKPVIVNTFALMDETEYDRRLDQVVAESVLDLSGEVRFLVTLAHRL